MSHFNSTIDEQEVKKFAQHATQWWDKDGPLKTLHDINDARVDFIRSHSQLAQATVLDVGCGGGILCEALAKQGARVTGIDVEEAAINTAIAHADDQKLTISYHCLPIEEYEHQSYDLITCMEMLEHVSQLNSLFNIANAS